MISLDKNELKVLKDLTGARIKTIRETFHSDVPVESRRALMEELPDLLRVAVKLDREFNSI